MLWSLWSQETVLTEPGESSASLGAASGLFKSKIRSFFSKPPVSNRCVSCKILPHYNFNNPYIKSTQSYKDCLKISRLLLTPEKAHARTICLCSNECNTSPVNASHSLLSKNIFIFSIKQGPQDV